MFQNILLNILLFIIIIIIAHYFWDFLKDSFTKKKTKDLVNTQIEKYKKIIDEIQSSPIADSKKEKKKEKEKNELLDFMNEVTEKFLPTTIDIEENLEIKQ